MTDEASPFLRPPPVSPERTVVLRAVLLLSALGHVVALALIARSEGAPAPKPRAADTVRVLRGEVLEGAEEPGLRLSGYAEVAIQGSLPPRLETLSR